MAKKVKFILSADIVANATEGLLLGEFNNWDKGTGFTMKKAKDGSLTATILLEEGRAYQYRYLLNDGRWVNDQSTGQYVKDNQFQVENCVILVPAEDVAAVAVVKAKASKAKPAAAVKEAKDSKAKTVAAVKETKDSKAKPAAVVVAKAKDSKAKPAAVKESKPAKK
jgi:1,4-alpha-glucan branching enzyme